MVKDFNYPCLLKHKTPPMRNLCKNILLEHISGNTETL